MSTFEIAPNPWSRPTNNISQWAAADINRFRSVDVDWSRNKKRCPNVVNVGADTQVSQVVYSKQPKLGLTQEFVVDCAHALWVVRSIKRLVSLMLLKWFLSDSFIYFMYRMFNEIF